jgi:hypothetical protein
MATGNRISELIVPLTEKHWVMRLPPAVTIQPQPYHPDVYRSQIAEQQDAEDAGAQTQKEKRAVALKRMNEVANTVRWRWQHGSGGVPVSWNLS